MGKGKNYITYKAGEKKCEHCGIPLGQITCSRPRKHFYCSNPQCAPGLKPHKFTRIQFILPGQRKCDALGCIKAVPARAYPYRQRIFCTDACERRHHEDCLHERDAHCAYCGRKLRRTPDRVRVSWCAGHRALAIKYALDRERCGPHLEIFRRYMEVAETHYRTTSNVRHELRDFFYSLQRQHVTDITEVQPRHISGFIRIRKKRGVQTVRADFVKVMFDWFIEEGIYRRPNPVRPRWHYSTEPEREARPYSEEELALIWRLLEERGDMRAKLAVAIGEECGTRSCETCNIRLSDVDLRSQQIWVRSPVKNNYLGFVPFASKTARFLRLWLQERDRRCGHDSLFTNERGGRLKVHSLRHLLKSILLKQSTNDSHDEGLEVFHYHRLRHTSATRLFHGGMDGRTIMKIHRWKSPSSLQRYIRILDSTEIQQYRDAIARSQAAPTLPPPSSPISITEFLKARSTNQQAS